MKFPKSLHAEGWSNHLETTTPEHLPPGLKPGRTARPSVRDEPLRAAPAEAPRVTAQATSTPATPHVAATGFSAVPPQAPGAGRTTALPPRSGVNPWVIGAGVGAVLIGLAVVMSRNLPSSEPVAPPTVVVQATPSPEEAQLQAAPPSAGPVTPAPEPEPAPAETPAVTAPPPAAEPRTEPRTEAPRTLATAPAEPRVAPPAVVRAAPTAPVTRTLSPAPETLAQVSPPPAALPQPPAVQPAQPAQPAVPQPAVVPPETVTPAVPPVAQVTPQPPAAVPEDAGITVNVRQALASDSTLAAVPIVVSTDHGVVKLEGQAPDAPTRERATVVAAGTQGVKAVDNRLTLPAAPVVSQVTLPSNSN